jgi:2',3'-cyclic-nucleotide 2'-phosphodiesterase (5'-nucleotidase family)
MRLTLLHFNDLHGRLDQLPRLATLIARARAQAHAQGRRVLLLEGGDSSDRKVWESDVTKGRANFTLLNALGVDVSVVGNGEALQWGRAALARLAQSAAFPLLAANLVDLADPAQLAAPDLRASHVFDVEDGRVGLIGVTARFGTGYIRYGFDAVDPIPIIQREVAALNAQGVRFIILLSHLGYFDRPAEEKKTYEARGDFDDEYVARHCPGLSVIVGAHSHAKLAQPLVVGETLIVQAGAFGEWLGQLELEVDSATGQVVSYAGQLHACDSSVPLDSALSATLELVREEAERLLAAPIATATRDWPHALDAPSPFAALTADALREICQADLCLLFSGFARRGLSAGPITRRDLREAFPGGVHVTAATVSGAQITRLLNRMLLSKFRTESFDPRRGEPPLGLPAVSSNVQFAFDLARAEPLLSVAVDGQPLDPARRYRLASTYYTLNDVTDDPDYDFIGLEPGQTIENIRVEQVLSEIIEDWLRARGTV